MIIALARNANEDPLPVGGLKLRIMQLGVLPALLLMAAAGAAAEAPSLTGSAACAEAAAGEDPAEVRLACQPGRERGNLVDGYNLALGLRLQDPEASLGHLSWAADGGLPEAAHVYGNLLLDEGEPERGLAQLAAAAQAGLVAAQYDYATALLETRGPDQRDTILYWYAQAAANGDQSARYNLGVLHLEGHLGSRDPILAWAWFSSLDALEGHPQVYRLVNRLAREMSSQDRRRAEDLRDTLKRDPMAFFE
ncbi:MAG: sel1 repeat family protein [Gammaproteobacteria bacterium]|nr:MAG: sel1 repeat family protein [Gammaproteobacteria bacterium]